ncbi:hypothetical protein [Leptolyngbya ohadii]|uniref:hypothetical protein n=1 Tax=Leptolyngbya ohadii TaxID=1962290 RepID=UPI001CEC7505|nr:hypothetical protein [Leptolyngbya ohadii]
MTDSAAMNPRLTDSTPTTVRLVCPQLPLAVYREVAAHLRQVDGVEVDLLPQTSQQFNYCDSQVGGLCLRYTSTVNAVSQQRVEQILRYYADRFGTWERLNSQF